MYGTFPTQDDVQDFKAMSRVLIRLCNKTAHFEYRASLEGLVRTCKIAIKEWPSLEAKFPQQVRIIENYQEFKRLLPRMFHWTPSTYVRKLPKLPEERDSPPLYMCYYARCTKHGLSFKHKLKNVLTLFEQKIRNLLTW